MSALAERATDLRAIHLGMIDAVLAGGGIAPVAALAAEHLGGSVAVVLPGSDVNVVEPRTDGPIVAEVPVRSGNEILGYVALLDAEPGPQTHEVLELAALAALTAVALRDAGMTKRRASAQLFDELRGPRPPAPDELIARAARLGADLSGGASALCLRPASDRALAALAQALPGTLAAIRGDTIEALVPTDTTNARRLTQHYDVGLSPFERDPAAFPTALRFAELALEFDGVEELLGGSWRLLLATPPRELRALIDSTVGALGDGPLLATLRAYLAGGANMKATADAIYAHRHTVANRLERIAALTGHDPQTPAGQAQLALGLQASEIWHAAKNR